MKLLYRNFSEALPRTILLSKNLLSNYRRLWSPTMLSYPTPLKYEGMMEKIDIKDASIAEEIRKQMAVATVSQKGLLSEKSVRFVKSSGIHIPKRTACIKLYSASGMTSVAAIISTGRVEAGRCGVFILSFTMAVSGEFSCSVNKINTGLLATFYYVKDGNKASIYLATAVDYSVTNISPLLEVGGFTYHLTEDTLPEGAVVIPIS